MKNVRDKGKPNEKCAGQLKILMKNVRDKGNPNEKCAGQLRILMKKCAGQMAHKFPAEFDTPKPLRKNVRDN